MITSPEGSAGDQGQDNAEQNNKDEKTFALTTERGEELFSTVNAIAEKVTSMETPFAELSKDATKLPGNNPAGGETLTWCNRRERNEHDTRSTKAG
ncbi:hypothetical protein O5698_23260 [Escherichia coli]|nr:hypothetical protein [Escherichia coli]